MHEERNWRLDPALADAAQNATDFVWSGFYEEGTFGPQTRAKYAEIIDAKGPQHRSDQVAALMTGLRMVVQMLAVLRESETGASTDETYAELKRFIAGVSN